MNTGGILYWWIFHTLLLFLALCSNADKCAEMIHELIGDGQGGNKTAYSESFRPMHPFPEDFRLEDKAATFFIHYRINYHACDPHSIVNIYIGKEHVQAVPVSSCLVEADGCAEVLKIDTFYVGRFSIKMTINDNLEPIDVAEVDLKKKYKITPTTNFRFGGDFDVVLGRGSYMPHRPDEIEVIISNLDWRLHIGKFTSIAQGLRLILMSKADHDYRSPTTYPFGIFFEDFQYLLDR